jgi:hypothetical protein
VWSARAQVASAACGVAPRHHRHRPPRGLERALGGHSVMHVASLHGSPVKGLAGEPLDTAELSAGAGVPHDRRFAVLRGDSAYGPGRARWVAKEKCVMLVRDHALARLRLRFDPDTMAPSSAHPASRRSRGRSARPRGASAPPGTSRASSSRRAARRRSSRRARCLVAEGRRAARRVGQRAGRADTPKPLIDRRIFLRPPPTPRECTRSGPTSLHRPGLA